MVFLFSHFIYVSYALYFAGDEIFTQ